VTKARRFGELYEQATRAYTAKDYAAAVPLLQAAFAIQSAPPLLYNIAQAYRKLAQYGPALVYLELYRSTDKAMAPEKAEQLEGIIQEVRAQERAAQKANVKVQVKLVEKTKTVYVQSDKPPPRWLRPLGIASGVVGLGLLTSGATLWGLDGTCVSAAVPPALECDQVYVTLTPGITLTVAGTGLLLTGAVAFGLSIKRPTRSVVVQESKPRTELLPEMPTLPAAPQTPPPPQDKPLPAGGPPSGSPDPNTQAEPPPSS
jgi:hypothetical protein